MAFKRCERDVVRLQNCNIRCLPYGEPNCPSSKEQNHIKSGSKNVRTLSEGSPDNKWRRGPQSSHNHEHGIGWLGHTQLQKYNSTGRKGSLTNRPCWSLSHAVPPGSLAHLSAATVSMVLRMSGYMSSTRLKFSTESEKTLQ